jgi:hypothetical protein
MGFLLVIMGFCMPITCNLNGFQIAEYTLGLDYQNALSLSLYALFFFSCIGGLLLFLLVLKKTFSPIVDWSIISGTIIVTFIIGFTLFEYSGGMGGAGYEIYKILQSGAYVILFGLAISVIFQIMYSCETETTPNNQSMQKVDLTGLIGTKCVVKAAVSIRNKPSQNSENIGLLQRNDIVSVYKTENEFSYIVTQDNNEGWCLSGCVEKID